MEGPSEQASPPLGVNCDSKKPCRPGIALDNMYTQDENGGEMSCPSPFRLLENGMTIEKLFQEDQSESEW